MLQRVQAAKEAARKAEERKGGKVSNECLDNPLAKGCQKPQLAFVWAR